MEEGQPVEALGLVHVGRGDDRRHPLRHHLVDDEPELAARDRVDAERRLVEEQHLRLVDEGAGEAELLLHAARELAGEAVAERAEVREREEPLEARRALGSRHPVEVGVEAEVLLDREVGVEAEALRHVGDAVLDRLGVAGDRDAGEDRVAGGGPQHAGEHAQRRGLAGAVRPDEAEQLAAADLEAQILDRGQLAEAAGEPLGADHRPVGHWALSRGASTGTSRRTSAGSPGFRSSSGSPVTRTLTS